MHHTPVQWTCPEAQEQLGKTLCKHCLLQTALPDGPCCSQPWPPSHTCVYLTLWLCEATQPSLPASPLPAHAALPSVPVEPSQRPALLSAPPPPAIPRSLQPLGCAAPTFKVPVLCPEHPVPRRLCLACASHSPPMASMSSWAPLGVSSAAHTLALPSLGLAIPPLRGGSICLIVTPWGRGLVGLRAEHVASLLSFPRSGGPAPLGLPAKLCPWQGTAILRPGSHRPCSGESLLSCPCALASSI